VTASDRRVIINNHFNTIDSMLRTIIGVSQVNCRFLNGAKYIRKVHCKQNMHIMVNEFTETQKEQIKLVSE